MVERIEHIEVFSSPDGPRFSFHVSKFMHGNSYCMQVLAPEGTGTFITGSEAEKRSGRLEIIDILQSLRL